MRNLSGSCTACEYGCIKDERGGTEDEGDKHEVMSSIIIFSFISVFFLLLMCLIYIYCRRRVINARHEKLKVRDEEKGKIENMHAAVIIGYYFPQYVAPIKVAATDREGKSNLKKMIKNVNHSLHEWKIYKDIHEPIDLNKDKIVGPKFKKKQKYLRHDFRQIKNQNYSQSFSDLSLESSVTNRESGAEVPVLNNNCKIAISPLEADSQDVPAAEEVCGSSDSSSGKDYESEYLNSEAGEIETPDILLTHKKQPSGITATKDKFALSVEENIDVEG